MYPLIRLAVELAQQSRAPSLPLTGTHVSRHRIWPQDIDVWGELNNGRTLTLYDLGRLSLFVRNGVGSALRHRGWGGTVAGVSVRYRARVRPFERVSMRSRILGWDDRFIYLDQSMWRGPDCTSQALLRTAVVARGRLVPTAKVEAALGVGSPPGLPGWVAGWIAAEAERPWPPETVS